MSPLLSDTNVLTAESIPHFIALMGLLEDNEISSRVAKDLLPEVMFELLDPKAAVEERGLKQASTDEALLPVVETIIAEHVGVVEEFKGGKEASLQFLIGQGMKATKGSANPAILSKLLRDTIQSK